MGSRSYTMGSYVNSWMTGATASTDLGGCEGWCGGALC
jgi:hypothetical protein